MSADATRSAETISAAPTRLTIRDGCYLVDESAELVDVDAGQKIGP
ncbi:MAG TPA: hypothetical protein VE261_08975 [Gaiellaceae bacterium]|nr:hypothetical protein [Gaiellaceae bacterium]